jgi:putative ABC transport system ATP-binding protein
MEHMTNIESAPLIVLEGIGKVFLMDEVETHALADVSFEIRTGEYVSICGPSGCGKSTLLAILGLLDTHDTGDYRLKGRSVTGLGTRARAQIRNHEIGYIFQSFNLIGDLTVLENVELPLTYRHEVSRRERTERASAALQRVGMTHRLKHYPAQLSGGQQQRVAAARALVVQPTILLADEPTGNLDSSNGESVMHLLEELHAGGATICVVTHDPRYADFAKRKVVLFDGRVTEDLGPRPQLGGDKRPSRQNATVNSLASLP